MNMNTNMNENGRKKRDLEITRKRDILNQFSNTTLNLNFTPEMLENFYEAFNECKNDFGAMEVKCEEEIVLLSWKNMRNILRHGDNDVFCVDPNLASNPLTSFTSDYIR